MGKEVVRSSECPLLEVPLYVTIVQRSQPTPDLWQEEEDEASLAVVSKFGLSDIKLAILGQWNVRNNYVASFHGPVLPRTRVLRYARYCDGSEEVGHDIISGWLPRPQLRNFDGRCARRRRARYNNYYYTLGECLAFLAGGSDPTIQL